MRKIVMGIVTGALFIAGISSASAADPTLVLSGGSTVFGLTPATIVGTASLPGNIAFSVGGVVIKGCEAVATTTDAAPFVAKCTWTPAAAGAAALTGVLTPTDTASKPVNSPTLNVKTGVPVQGGTVSPINIYVDTVLASGTTGVLAGRFGVACAITSQYIIGQTIVFRVYANNADLGGATMDSSNTASAYITVQGWPKQIPLTYGNHSGVAFWTGVLATGSDAGKYSTLGIINYKVTMVAKDSTTAKTIATKRVPRTDSNGKQVVNADGSLAYDYASFYRTLTLKHPIKGATGTWSSNFTATSQLTLYAVPTP